MKGSESRFEETTLKGLSIKWRIVFVLIVIFAILGIFFSWYIPNTSKKLVEASLLDKGESLSSILAFNSKTAIYVESEEKLKDILDSTIKDKDVIYVEVYTSKGKRLASKVKKKAPKSVDLLSLADSYEPVTYRHPTHIDFITPVIREIIAGGEEDDFLGFEMESVDDGALDIQGEKEVKKEVIGFVRLGLDIVSIETRKKEIAGRSILFSSIIFICALILSYVVISSIVRRINSISQLAGVITNGDLTKELPEKGGDEIGLMASTFNNMVRGLSNIVKKIIDSVSFLTDTTQNLIESGKTMTKAAKSQEDEIYMTMQATTDLTSSINRIAGDSDAVRKSISDITLSVNRIDSSIKEMNVNFSTFSDAISTTASAITELNASIKGIASSSEELKRISQESQEKIRYLSKSIGDIDGLSKEASIIAQDTESSASKGVDSLSKIVESMSEINNSFSEVKKNIAELDNEIIGISEVVKVIDDFAKKTHLLSLNAAIIASRVVDQGREFRVVAEEIKRLATFTTDSVQKIEERVNSIKEKSEVVNQVITDGEQKVDRGVILSKDTDRAFNEILERLKTSAETTNYISNLTESQKIKTKEVNNHIEMIARSADEISTATKEEAISIDSIKKSSDNLQFVAEDISKMIKDQTEVSADISRSMESINKLVRTLNESQEQELKASRDIGTAMKNLEGVVLASKESLFKVGKMVEELGTLGDRLKDEVHRFRV